MEDSSDLKLAVYSERIFTNHDEEKRAPVTA
jgi:hypothetical protein